MKPDSLFTVNANDLTTESGTGGTATWPDSSSIVYRPPFAWTTNNRIRQFIPLPKREYSRETDFEILSRSVNRLLKEQDSRGSFYTDDQYLQGDIVDDQLGGASALAGFLAFTKKAPGLNEPLERAVRFHLDHLVQPETMEQPYRFSRYFQDRDTSGDWCNTNWCLWGGALVLRHGIPYLSPKTASDLRDVMDDAWKFISTYPTRDENPCHNQLLAYCDIGFLYAQTTGNKAVMDEILDYYHERLRRLRIYDRGHWIYAEFNQWDANYAMLSWMALENLFAASGDPAFEEDAEEMALAFNERVSAGGYFWGGSRREEGGLDEFIQAPARWAGELGLDRLLLPEPSNLWREFVFDGHYSKGLVHRMDTVLKPRTSRRLLMPTPWHFHNGAASVCLQDDLKLHHLSAAGLELIPVAGENGLGSGLAWVDKGAWKTDFMQVHPPKSSEGMSYCSSGTIQFGEFTGIMTMQRGSLWETRQWWLSRGENLLWVGQLVPHGFVAFERLEFILGNPVLNCVGQQVKPVTEARCPEGNSVDTQGPAASLISDKFLRFGDAIIRGTAPIEFIRTSKDSFHTFPVSGMRMQDFASSNQLRIRLVEAPTTMDCRESLFFAVEIGREAPSLSTHHEAKKWDLESSLGVFEARQRAGLWHHTFVTPQERWKLPHNGFGFTAK